MELPSTERLLAALEACAAALEEGVRQEEGAVRQAGGVPRLRRPAMGGSYAAGSPEFRGLTAEPDPHAALAMGELARECRDVIVEVRAGKAGKGWVHSLAGRVSQYVVEDVVEELSRAAEGYFAAR